MIRFGSATSADLSEVGNDYPHWVTDYFLQLPFTMPERVKQLSEIVTKEAKTPYEKVRVIGNYLAQIDYNSQVEAPPEGSDGVDYFLFTQKSGNCVYYASAMAVMLRSVGVPSRLCVGYPPYDWDAANESLTLRAKDYHSWLEVYFPGYGWIEFDPTPTAGTGLEIFPLADDIILDDPDEWEEWMDEELEDDMPGALGGVAALRNRLGLGLPFVIIGAIVLLIFGLRSIVSRWFRGSTGLSYASEIYSKMCFLASLARLGPRPQQTPLEYCAALASAFPLQADAFGNIVQTYVESQYSPRKKLLLLQQWTLRKSWREVYPALLKRLFRVMKFRQRP